MGRDVGFPGHGFAAKDHRFGAGPVEIRQKLAAQAGGKPLVLLEAGYRGSRGQGPAVLEVQIPGQGEGLGRQAGGAQGQAMIGLGAGEGHRAFHHPKPVHGRGAPLGGEGPHRFGVVAVEEIRAQGKDHLGLVQVAFQCHGRAEGRIGPLQGPFPRGRFPFKVPKARKGLAQAGQELLAGGAGDGAGEQEDLLILVPGGAKGRDQRAQGLLPGGWPAIDARAAQAIRVIEAQHPGQGSGAGLALQPGMLVVAGDVDGAAFAGLHQHRAGVPALGEGAGVEGGHPGHDFPGAAGVGHHQLADAVLAAQGGRCRRQPQQPHEVAAGKPGVGGSQGLGVEFLLGGLAGPGAFPPLLQGAPVARGPDRLSHGASPTFPAG